MWYMFGKIFVYVTILGKRSNFLSRITQSSEYESDGMK
jgi:hypothetical protein